MQERALNTNILATDRSELDNSTISFKLSKDLKSTEIGVQK